MADWASRLDGKGRLRPAEHANRLTAMPSREAQWIIGVIVGAVIALSVQIAGVRTDQRTQFSEIRTDIRRLDDRIRAVEVEFGKVDQRLATLERLHLPTPGPADD